MKIERSDAQHLKAYTQDLAGYERLVPCLRTLAMGDTNAVAYGQAAHLGVLLHKTSLRLRDFVTLKQRPDLKKRWMAGLMIDDFVLLEAYKKDSDSEVRCKEIIEEVHRAYDDVKLPRHTGKSVCGETRGSFWGVELNGEDCRFRPVLAIPLAQLILEIVDLGQASVGLLEVVGGCLVSIFQLRRRFMSALQEIYGSQRGRDRREVVQLSQELKEEMIKCVPLIMLTNLDMKMRGAPLLVASDASSRYEAAVAADVGEEATEVLQQLGLQKGLWSKLLRPVQAFEREKGGAMGVSEAELPGEQYTIHPAWQEICRGVEFHPLGFVKKVKGRRHINEADMGRRYPGRFYVHLQDSQVSLAALVKGRSASSSLNERRRCSIQLRIQPMIPLG